MKTKSVLICSLLIVFLLGLFFIPLDRNLNNKYIENVNAIAFAYPVYVSDMCPNKSGLDDIRTSYLKTINEKDVAQQKWVHDNFNKVFQDYCHKYEGDK